MKDFLEIVTVFLLSAVKFGLGGVSSAVLAKFSFFKAFTITVSGGITGTFIFMQLSEFLIKRAKRIRENVREQKGKSPKKKFTATNKFIVRVKRKLGLAGLAMLTPSFTSIPIGVLLAVRYYKDKQRIMKAMTLSIVCWEVFFYFFWYYMVDMIKRLF